MNIFLWVLQVLLALHTTSGAIWKFSNSSQDVPSLSVIPHGVWLSLSIIELACALCLIVPAVSKRLSVLAPAAAFFVAAEMLMYCVLDIFSAEPDYGHIMYWGVVAVFSAFIAYGRFVMKPIQRSATEGSPS
jgi:hypothetical protein